MIILREDTSEYSDDILKNDLQSILDKKDLHEFVVKNVHVSVETNDIKIRIKIPFSYIEDILLSMISFDINDDIDQSLYKDTVDNIMSKIVYTSPNLDSIISKYIDSDYDVRYYSVNDKYYELEFSGTCIV